MGNYKNIKLINILFSDSEEFDLYKNKKYYSIDYSKSSISSGVTFLTSVSI